MNQLVKILFGEICKQIVKNRPNLIRLEHINDPNIYRDICELFKKAENIQEFIPKLTYRKYRDFVKCNNSEWKQALEYLHKGTNNVYSEFEIDEVYKENSFVDFDDAITNWRNKISKYIDKNTVVILLMGTEVAIDTGGLEDTSFVFSPKELVGKLKKRGKTAYSIWFEDIISKNHLSDDCRVAVNEIYKALFRKINIDVFKLSNFIDSLYEVSFDSDQELVDYICESLSEVWNIPSIKDNKYIPKVSKLKSNAKAETKILTNAIKFIDRENDIPTEATVSKLRNKFETYAKDNGIIEDMPFPEINPIFTDYVEFQDTVIDFMRGINLEENRKKILSTDYSTIESIIGVKLEKVAKDKTQAYTGSPVEVYSKMILDAMKNYKQKKKSLPHKISISVDSISMPSCPDEEVESFFMYICNFTGGILNLFNRDGIDIDGNMLELGYVNNEYDDPFDFSNYRLLKDKIKNTAKVGSPFKVKFIFKAKNNDGPEVKTEYTWAFSAYSAWLNAFSYLSNVIYSGETLIVLPTLVVCSGMQDYLVCESEEEFYNRMQQFQGCVLDEKHKVEIRKYFSNEQNNGLAAEFDLLCGKFRRFASKLTEHGFFNAGTELRELVDCYTLLMQHIKENYKNYTDVQKEKLPLLINVFEITSNEKILENADMAEVIVPAYHPIMLEKIDAQQNYLGDGFTELLREFIENDKVNFNLKLENLVQLSSITQGPDVIWKRAQDYLTCKNMWQYFGVYYKTNNHQGILSSNTSGMSIVSEEVLDSAMLQKTPMSNIIVRNVLDYIRTFPARMDGINIAFLAPDDMQHIVSAIHLIAKDLENKEADAVINVKIICMNSNRNSTTYLRQWLDSYFTDEHRVKVNTYLYNLVVDNERNIDNLKELISDYDICFTYNILKSTGVEFDMSADDISDINYEKFPLTFTPDTIPATHGKARKVNKSHFQFLANKQHTQASYRVGYPHSADGLYRAYQTLELKDVQKDIINIAHNVCRWVVCIDPAIDRHMLEHSNSTENNKIIGFTTGEGSYGELNVTVSARNDLLKDIKKMLLRRIREKFSNWDEERLKSASEYCVDELSCYMDGSRILKALNPYDYEIHNFLAYVLTMQMLGLSKPDDTNLVRVLISLDSYRHWFSDSSKADNTRPDFMLLEIPRCSENLSENSKLKIRAKIIECKMGFQNDQLIEKAQEQLKKGIHTMSLNWNPNASGVRHRYWMNQLYRAIIFSPLNMDNTCDEYRTVRDKIYGILNSEFEISWTGDIFAFWLDRESEEVNVSDIDIYFEDNDVLIDELKCHECGQMYIQKMLLPEEKRQESFSYNDCYPEEENIEDTNEEPEDADKDIFDFGINYTDRELSGENNEVSGATIPKTADVYWPFIEYLSDELEHSRKESLMWYKKYFSISEKDQKLIYESNGHLKWETVFDVAITDFRKWKLLENSQYGVFHITELGKMMISSRYAEGNSVDFSEILRIAQDKIDNRNNNEPLVDTLEEEDITEDIDKLDGKSKNENHIEEVEVSKNNVNGLQANSLKDVRLLLGRDIRTNEPYYWEFGHKELTDRHLLINGNSGSGKTYCIQALLMEAALNGVSSVVFDYTSGFTPSKLDPIFKDTLGNRIQQRVVKVDKIPVNPFAKYEIKIDEDLFVPEEDADVADKIAEILKAVYDLGDQQRSAVYSAVLSGLKKYGSRMSFKEMVYELEKIGTGPSKSVISKIQTFTDYNPFTVDEKFNWFDIRDSKGTVYVFQLAGYNSREIQVILTEFLLWDIWNFCVKNGDETTPFILVMDEAQNLNHGDKSPSAKILTEGRKFGISAWYATQFMKPQLSDDEIQRLQQAAQKLYFCPPDDGTMPVAKNISITDYKEWADRLTKLKKGECVTCGYMDRNGRWIKYDPRIIKITSLKERVDND